MKKLYLFILLSFFSVTSHASGAFDGIYAISVNGVVANYATVHEDAVTNQMIVVIISPDTSEAWSALSGVRGINNIAALTSITGASASDITLNITVAFNNNNTTPLATVASCVNGTFYACKFPNGTQLNMSKIF